jgi:hypothetical protein
MPQHIHMAGIIPVAGLETDFNQQLPEVMMPVDAGFTAIQKSVYECAMVGCQTIWIVANNDLAPIIRNTVGEWIYDPVYYETKSMFPSENRKEIPIYSLWSIQRMVGSSKNIKMDTARKVLRFVSVVGLRSAVAAFSSYRNSIEGRQLLCFLRW